MQFKDFLDFDLSKSFQNLSFDHYSQEQFPTKMGWLKKKSPNIFRGWQNRFFVLYNKKLYYFKNQNCIKVKGVLNFDLVSVDIQLGSGAKTSQLHLCPQANQRIFSLKAKNHQSLSSWLSAISLHIIHSKGAQVSLLKPQNCFWRFDYISVNDFQLQACTGDIILFRAKSLFARIQRCITRSQYDHIALVLRYNNSNLALLQATSQEGVSVVNFQEFKTNDWVSMYHRIAYKHLNIERDQKFSKKFEEFLFNVQGKKYGITPRKLMRKFRKQVPGQQNNFFCSQLVASAYKHLGILPSKISSANYWPGDFADGSKIRPCKGNLWPEQVIDFAQDKFKFKMWCQDQNDGENKKKELANKEQKVEKFDERSKGLSLVEVKKFKK